MLCLLPSLVQPHQQGVVLELRSFRSSHPPYYSFLPPPHPHPFIFPDRALALSLRTETQNTTTTPYTLSNKTTQQTPQPVASEEKNKQEFPLTEFSNFRSGRTGFVFTSLPLCHTANKQTQFLFLITDEEVKALTLLHNEK